MAEQLIDAITEVTGVPERCQGFPLGTRAITIPRGSPSYFLTVFGRARTREVICERNTMSAIKFLKISSHCLCSVRAQSSLEKPDSLLWAALARDFELLSALLVVGHEELFYLRQKRFIGREAGLIFAKWTIETQ